MPPPRSAPTAGYAAGRSRRNDRTTSQNASPHSRLLAANNNHHASAVTGNRIALKSGSRGNDSTTNATSAARSKADEAPESNRDLPRIILKKNSTTKAAK